MKLISSPHSVGTKPREVGGKEHTARLRHATYYCDLLKALDALIPNIPIVTKLKSGNKQQAKESALKIKMATDENSIICPGHLNMIKSTEINWNIYINE